MAAGKSLLESPNLSTNISETSTRNAKGDLDGFEIKGYPFLSAKREASSPHVFPNEIPPVYPTGNRPQIGQANWDDEQGLGLRAYNSSLFASPSSVFENKQLSDNLFRKR